MPNPDDILWVVEWSDAAGRWFVACVRRTPGAAEHQYEKLRLNADPKMIEIRFRRFVANEV